MVHKFQNSFGVVYVKIFKDYSFSIQDSRLVALNLSLVKDHFFKSPHFCAISGSSAFDYFTALAICELICKFQKLVYTLFNKMHPPQ